MEDRWDDEGPVYKIYSAKEIKYYHGLLCDDVKRTESLIVDYKDKLAGLEAKPQLGIQHHREVKKIKNKIKQHNEKRNNASFRVTKIEREIKDWFKPLVSVAK